MTIHATRPGHITLCNDPINPQDPPSGVVPAPPELPTGQIMDITCPGCRNITAYEMLINLFLDRYPQKHEEQANHMMNNLYRQWGTTPEPMTRTGTPPFLLTPQEIEWVATNLEGTMADLPGVTVSTIHRLRLQTTLAHAGVPKDQMASSAIDAYIIENCLDQGLEPQLPKHIRRVEPTQLQRPPLPTLLLI